MSGSVSGEMSWYWQGADACAQATMYKTLELEIEGFGSFVLSEGGGEGV